MPIIKNSEIKSIWVKELIFYSKNIKSVRYKDSKKLIESFSSELNFKKWEKIVSNILDSEKIKTILLK